MRPFVHQSDEAITITVPTLADGVAQVLLPLVLDTEDPANRHTISEFTGALQDVLFALLKGNASLEVRRVLGTRSIPKLMIDDTAFGRSSGPGDYLIARRSSDKSLSLADGVEVLEPDSHEFRPLSQATGAFPSFEDGCRWLVGYLRAQGATLEQVRQMGVRVVPVAHVTARPEGFIVATHRW